MSTISIWGSMWEDVWVSLWGTDAVGACNFSTYSDGSKVPFDDGVPATGDIYSTVNGVLIGYRDPVTFVFTPEPGTAEIFELDGFNVSTGIVPKFNTLSAIAVKWLTALGVEQNDTEPVIAHTYATDVDVTRDNSDAVTYSHKTGLPIPSLKSYYLDDGVTEVDFLGVYEVPHTVSNPIKFGWTVTNGNVDGVVEQTTFSATVDAGATETLTLPVFTDDWGNSATLASREYTIDREQAVSITVPLEGTLSNESTEIVTWINKYDVTVNDSETIADHETATDVSIIRGDVGNQGTVTISHKTGLPIPALLYYRDDLNTRVDFNGVYEIPNTVATPVTLGWSITNGNVSTEVEQTEFSELLVIDTENEITMPTFTDSWGNEASLLSRTITVEYGGTIEYATTYISDLIPTSYVVGYGSLQKDKSVDGNPLTIDGIVYSKGWGAHASGYIEHDISDGYDLFSVVMGWDDESVPPNEGDRPDINISVELDGVQECTCALDGDATLPITSEISVVGKSTLRIVFLSVGGIDCQHLDLADAKLLKEI